METTHDRKKMERCAACACFNIRKAARVVTQLFDHSMQSSGLRSTQFSILAVLSLAGPAAVTFLSEQLLMDRTTLTRNLRPLEKQGFVAIEPGKDLRVRTVSLTPAGFKMLDTIFPLWKRAQDHMIRKLGRERFNSFIGDLSDISQFFSKGP